MHAYSFGSFVLDAQQRVLLQGEEIVSLTPKAFEMLALLVESSGRVVSREEISQVVWHDVYIDESNITKNISLLRKLLRPHFDQDPIRTVPKRGYQFVLPVITLPSAPAFNPTPVVGPPVAAPLTDVEADERELTRHQQPASRNLLLRHRWRIVLILSSVLILLVIGIFALHRHREEESGRRIAVLPFSNLSGSPDVAWVSTALRETLLSELDAGERLRAVPDEAVEQMTRDLSFQPSASLSTGTLASIRSNLGCTYIVSGSYLKVGDELRLDAYLQDVRTGKIVTRTSETRPAGELIGTISRVGDSLRSALGEDHLLGEQRQQIAASIPAGSANLQLYGEGLQRLRMLDTPGALSAFTRLVALDGSYALAHSALSETYELMGQDRQSVIEAKLALDHAGGLSREERLLLQANYERARRHWPEAIAAQQTLWQTFPDDNDYGVRLAQVQLLAGKPQDALATVARLEGTSGREDPRVYLAEGSIRYQTGEFPAMLTAARQAEKLAQERGAQTLNGRARTQEGDALIHVGTVDQARAAFGEARAIAQKYNDKVGLMHALRRDGGALGTSDPRASVALFEQDCAIAKEIGDARETVNCQISIGFAHQRLGEFAQASTSFSQALPRARAIEDTRLVLVCLEALGSDQVRLALWTQANETLTEAEGLAASKKSLSMQHMILGDRSRLFETHDDLGKAKELAERAVSLARGGNDPLGLARELKQLASVLTAQRNLAGAAAALQEACTLAEKSGQALLSAEYKVALADIAFQQNDLAQAESLVDRTRFDKQSIVPGFSAARLQTEMAIARRDIPAARTAAGLANLIAQSATGDLKLKLDNALVQAKVRHASGETRAAAVLFTAVYKQAGAAGLTREEESARRALNK